GDAGGRGTPWAGRQHAPRRCRKARAAAQRQSGRPEGPAVGTGRSWTDLRFRSSQSQRPGSDQSSPAPTPDAPRPANTLPSCLAPSIMLSMDTSDMARARGRKGGKARAARLAPSEKRRIAALGGRARALSLHASRRVAENFRYVEVLHALQPRPPVV